MPKKEEPSSATKLACFFCGNKTEDIALLRNPPEDTEDSRNAILAMEPCQDCIHKTETHACFVEADIVDNKLVRLRNSVFIPLEEVAGIVPNQAIVEEILEDRFVLLQPDMWNKTFPRNTPTIEA